MALQTHGSFLPMQHIDGRAVRKHLSMQLQSCSSPMARGVGIYQHELAPKQPTQRIGLRAWKEVNAANVHPAVHFKVYLQHSRTQNEHEKRLHRLIFRPA